eukprot:9965830-Ditylum_brightwellii.AAC.1
MVALVETLDVVLSYIVEQRKGWIRQKRGAACPYVNNKVAVMTKKKMQRGIQQFIQGQKLPRTDKMKRMVQLKALRMSIREIKS